MEKSSEVGESQKNNKYQDILKTQWPPEKRLRPQMNLQERAKIFLPFAALKGHEENLENIAFSKEISLIR